MSRTEKKFDAVEMMREIREKLSAQIEGMTLEEELQWLASHELKGSARNKLDNLGSKCAPYWVAPN